MRDSLNSKLSDLTQEVGQLKADIFDLRQENDSLKQMLFESKSKIKALEERVVEAEHSARVARERSNHTEQYSRLWNVKILGVPEVSVSGKGETAAESEKHALNVFHDKLDLKHITSADLDAVHRIGDRKKDNTKGPRPIIVRFVSRKTRQQVLQRRKRLKGSRVVVVDDLTQANYFLFQSVAQHPGALKAWSKDGVVFAESLMNKVVRIEKQQDIGMKLPIDALPETALPALRERLKYLARKNAKWNDIFSALPARSDNDRDSTKTKEMVQIAANEMLSNWK
jgi:hypothetical protein